MKTTSNTHASHSEEQLPAPARRSRATTAILILAIVATALASAVSLVPAAQFEGWRWLVLVLMSVPVLASADRAHRSAWTHLRRGVSHPDILASIASLATYAWAAATIESGDASRGVTVAAATALLVTAVHYVRNDRRTDGAAPPWLVPALLSLALAALLGWWIYDDLAKGSSAAIAVLVVGCGAAFLLATPSAISTGTKRGVKLGLQFGGVTVLEAARRIDTIVLDKNHTVTNGGLTVISVDALDPGHDLNLRWFAGALEHSADDPVGRAIAKLAKLTSSRGLTNIEHQPGRGVSGVVDRHLVRVGSPDWIGFDAPREVGTTVVVEVDGRAMGSITVADDIRPHAQEAVEELRRLGLEVILASDGNPIDTEHVAKHVGIDIHFAEQGADDRSELVTTLQNDGHTVAMVGDNDLNAPALHTADLAITGITGVAPSDDATDVRLIVADINASVIAGAIALARATLATVRLNRRIALAATLLPAPFAAAGLIGPLFAVLIAVTGTVIVACNSLRLRAPVLHAHAD